MFKIDFELIPDNIKIIVKLDLDNLDLQKITFLTGKAQRLIDAGVGQYVNMLEIGKKLSYYLAYGETVRIEKHSDSEIIMTASCITREILKNIEVLAIIGLVILDDNDEYI